MSVHLQVALLTTLWCLLHSVFVTHAWRNLVRRRWPAFAPAQRLTYVAFSTMSLAAWAWWIRTLPEHLLWDWNGPWQAVRAAGLLIGAAFLILGARAHDGRAFLGWKTWRDRNHNLKSADIELQTDGILGRVRHPWYTATLFLIAFCLPWTDLNLIWRTIFFVYTLIGTILEEKKLTKELGYKYLVYREQVPRFLPKWRPKDSGQSLD